jgi:hypothetical protein
MRTVLVTPIATLTDDLIAAPKTTNHGHSAPAAGLGIFGLT